MTPSNPIPMIRAHCPFTVLLFSAFLTLPTSRHGVRAAVEPPAAGGAPEVRAPVTYTADVEVSRASAPKYPTTYALASVEEITAVLDRVHTYLESCTPAVLINRETQQEITNPARIDNQSVLAQGSFRILSYEWGVTYSGMLLAAEVTGDRRFREYVDRRLGFVATVAPRFRAQLEANRSDTNNVFRKVLAPHSLDDAGSIATAMIKAHRAGLGGDLRPLIDNCLHHISTGQMRLADGTLARNDPLPDSLWLDDLYMSVPALAQMGKLTGERRYYDDAVKQILQFADRMFVREKGLYMHGWVQGMSVHPAFFWGRANGWAIMAKTELLEVLPEDHPGRPAVLELLRAHIHGLAAVQGHAGRWHQLLDRAESYEETSATAIFTFCIARAINRGWIDTLAHGPMASLGWNAVAKMVNDKGQVEGTCIGTGMGWDPMFYMYRPVSVHAAHGYGPVLLAGAEMMLLRQGKGAKATIRHEAVQFGSVTAAERESVSSSAGPNSIVARKAARDFPSVFQAWSPAEVPGENPLVATSRHDLVWSGPESFGLEWNHDYVGLATSFKPTSIQRGVEFRQSLLKLNPKIILLAEIRYRDAPDRLPAKYAEAWKNLGRGEWRGYLPTDHQWWKRLPNGSPEPGWDEGNFFQLDVSNPEFRAQVARQCQAVVATGVVDGVMLDWWEDDPDRLALIQAVRQAVGEHALIVANSNDRQIPMTAPYINGLFMECYRSKTAEEWKQIEGTLAWAEEHLREPRINCLETWFATSRQDLNRMRATTTLSLTQSDGYCLFSDPNPLPTPDHLHDWYPFWNKSLGKPCGEGKQRSDGAWEREFEHGTAVYNPMHNQTVRVAFTEQRTSAATGAPAREFVLPPLDGDLYLQAKGSISGEARAPR